MKKKLKFLDSKKNSSKQFSNISKRLDSQEAKKLFQITNCSKNQKKIKFHLKMKRREEGSKEKTLCKRQKIHSSVKKFLQHQVFSKKASFKEMGQKVQMNLNGLKNSDKRTQYKTPFSPEIYARKFQL